MAVSFTPYLSFRGTAREAMQWYQSIFGGELNVMSFADGGMTDGVDDANQVMHSSLEGPVAIMGADVPSSMPMDEGSRISLCFGGSAEDLSTCQEYYEKLGESAASTLPFNQAPWGDYYGEIVDRFGIRWMFDCGAPAVPDDASSLSSQQSTAL